MSHRLQVLISPELDAQLEKAAQRSGVSKGEWVRRALKDSLKKGRPDRGPSDPLARLASLNAPVSDIDQMLNEIESGRS